MSKRTRKEEGSGREVVARGGLKLYHHTASCCCSTGSLQEEGPPPSSTSLVSMTRRRRRRLQSAGGTASEAGGSPQLPSAGDGTLMDGEEAEKAPSHLGEAGSSRERSQHEEGGKGEAGEVVRGTRGVGGAGLSAALGGPTGGWLSSASLAWEARRRNLLRETRSLRRSWRRCRFEELGQIC